MGTFTADLSAFCKKEAPGILDNTVRKIVIEVGNRLVMRSPVGDASLWQNPDLAPAGYVGGRFRANWQYGFSAAPSGDLADIDPSGMAAISRIIAGTFSSKAVGQHHITNNLPYAQRLEDGYSSQAPAGMVTLVELEFPQIVAMAKA